MALDAWATSREPPGERLAGVIRARERQKSGELAIPPWYDGASLCVAA